MYHAGVCGIDIFVSLSWPGVAVSIRMVKEAGENWQQWEGVDLAILAPLKLCDDEGHDRTNSNQRKSSVGIFNLPESLTNPSWPR